MVVLSSVWADTLWRCVHAELHQADADLRAWAAPRLTNNPSLSDLLRVYAVLRLARTPAPDVEIVNLSASLVFWPR